MPLKLRYFLFVFCILTFNFSLKADHYLGASIAYKSLGGFTYEFTVIVYTDAEILKSDKDALTLFCGDDKHVVLSRTNGAGKGTLLNPGIRKSIYKGQYTYLKDGNYNVFLSEEWRHGSVNNINAGNSDFKKLHVSTTLPVYADPSICVNNSAEYQLDPIFYAYSGVEYATNFGLHDSDGDSLSFALSTCKGANGLTVENYFIPSTVSVNPLTGNLTWTNPAQGMYSFAMMVTEFRKGKMIGVSSIDFLIFVSTGFTKAPVFTLDPQFTLNADGAYEITINPSDLLKYGIGISLAGTHTITYSVWNNTDAIIADNPVKTSSSVTDTLKWTTQLANGRRAPYFFVHRFSIFENGQYLQKDFAVPVYVRGNQTITCTVPDISKLEKVTPELPIFVISPCPFTDGVYINIDNPASITDIIIYDIQGREMEGYTNFTEGTIYLDLSHLASAVYIVRIREGDYVVKKSILKL